ncbi:arsenical pump-driving ATPase [Streptomyces humidus]|uniref:Arsenical pump-driving ATPase n=1 Tax=Streptomyces humidus TaxID=52259 RepID=A0A918G844_9ACTN|nr:arsenical pump-driving ATPase [Streptomyces humidus]GGS23154.1 arsenical pump-driving ATPase [Streptomyces humidus]
MRDPNGSDLAARVPPLPMLEWGSWHTPFVFFTGKGGVGKTTVAGAVSIALADAGRRVLMVSTDPASNLGDLLSTAVGPAPGPVPGVPGLEAMNLDPDAAAAAYRERVVAPYRGAVPQEELHALEEQLAGECTVEVAAFDRFTQLIVHPELIGRYDHVLFDTAPTGHTLRLLNLPSSWAQYIESVPEGASCLGPRSGLQAQRTQYQAAVEYLSDPGRTTLVLTSRPERGALREAGRAGAELAAQGIHNQHLIVNGLFTEPLAGDTVAEAFADRQASALDALPASLRAIPSAGVPLVAWNLTGIRALRALVRGQGGPVSGPDVPADVGADERQTPLPSLEALVDELAAGPPGAVLVMGKGGVGKTTIAAAVAVGLARRGHDVHLSTTDPAGRPADVLAGGPFRHLTVSRIDPAAELADYTAERLRAAERMSPDRRALLEEDLRSPCTEELAVFRAFGALLNTARRRFVVVDTAPSGHTLRLLDLTGSYHRQVMADAARVPGRITTPLMRLRDPAHTRVLIVTLPELTPVSEAAVLQDGLRQAGIEPYGWVVNAALTAGGTRDPLLHARAALERPQLHRVRDELAARAWLVPWQADTLIGEDRLAALTDATSR